MRQQLGVVRGLGEVTRQRRPASGGHVRARPARPVTSRRRARASGRQHPARRRRKEPSHPDREAVEPRRVRSRRHDGRRVRGRRRSETGRRAQARERRRVLSAHDTGRARHPTRSPRRIPRASRTRAPCRATAFSRSSRACATRRRSTASTRRSAGVREDEGGWGRVGFTLRVHAARALTKLTSP